MGPWTAIFYIISILVFKSSSTAAFGQQFYQDAVNNLSLNLQHLMVSVARGAAHPQPKLGVEIPIDPLSAVAPLRYLHDGDLLKLRLLLSNVTLKGLSSMAVQEVMFVDVKLAVPAVKHSDSHSVVDDFSEFDFLPEFKDRPITDESNGEFDDYYDYHNGDDDEDEYEVMTSKNSLPKNSEDEPTVEVQSMVDPQLEIDDEDYYQGDQPVLVRSEDHDGASKGLEGSGDGGGPDTEHHKKPKSPKRKHWKHNCKKPSNHSRGSRNRKQVDSRREITDLESFEQQFLKDYDEIVKKSKLERSKRSAPRHSDAIRTRHRHRRNMKSNPEVHDVTEDLVRPVGHSERGRKRSDKFRIVTTNVRVAFRDLRVEALYLIKGKAGGVLSFKEQGKLVLKISTAFLTSTFNITLIPDVSSLRHWKNNRSTHIRVQTVRSRLSLDTPSLKLIPDSRPTEWVRQQLKEKMDELARGIGKRDGAVRLLLRNWVKLLRRLLARASKQ